ncbi:5-methylcytosine restriction system specificity protein McrC [Limosilactobacillus mucosae]
MSELQGIKNQTIINVLDKEVPFFEEFTRKQGIDWPSDQKNNGLLILSASMVGFIITPYREIKLPVKYSEITFEHILRMYLYVHTYRNNDDAKELDVTSNNDDLDITKSFFRLLEKQLNNGIIRTYEKTNVNSRTVVGRVNWIKSYENILKRKSNPIVAQNYKLTTNNDINRLIVGALNKLSHSNLYALQARNYLDFFSDVKNPIQKKGTNFLHTIVFNSNTNRYRKILNYAAMIIDNTDYSDLGNNTGMQSFLLNFDALYEDFVIKVLTEESHTQGFSTWGRMHVFAQSSFNNEIVYKPDILFKYIKEDPNNDYKESSFGVLDCKNKAHSVFKNADVYQIISYSRKLAAKKTILLYPSFEPKVHEVLSLDYDLFSPSVIYAVFVNIANDEGEEFLESVRSFAKDVVTILNS